LNRSRVVRRNRIQDFSLEKYGEKTDEKENARNQLLAEYAFMLASLPQRGRVGLESRSRAKNCRKTELA